MAKRRSGSAPEQDVIRTTVCLARHTHAKISALASLNGSTINALLVAAAEDIVKGIVIHDRRKSAGPVAPSVLAIQSADDAA